MKIALTVPGRFHAFDVAKRLQKKEVLGKLFTRFPKFEVAKYGIDPRLVEGFPLLEGFSRLVNKLPPQVRLNWNPQYFVSRKFDEWVSKHLGSENDLLVAFSGSALATSKRAHEMGMKVVLERHSAHMLEQRKILSDEYAKFGLPFLETHPGVMEQELKEYEEADLINVPSTFVRDTFIEKGFPASKILCMQLGVDLSAFSPRARRDSKFRVVYAGSLSIRKGVIYLLRALKGLKDVELWLIGEVTPEFRKTARKFESPNIRFFSRQPQSELSTLFSQCDVFCLPSVEDGFGLVLGQAMACGLPVICSANAGAKDLVREGIDGFCVPPANAEAIKEKTVWFCENREKTREMGSAALERIKTAYNWDTYVDRLMVEFDGLLQRKTLSSFRGGEADRLASLAAGSAISTDPMNS